MKEIKLINGGVAIVDDEDHERLAKFKWYPKIRKIGGTVYAVRFTWDNQTHRNRNVYMHHEVMPIEAGFVSDHINSNGIDKGITYLTPVEGNDD